MNPKDIGITLKELRNERGLTQKTLSDIFSVDVTTISKWENGSANIGLNEITQIANYFNLSLDEFVNYQDKKRKIEQAELDKQRQLVQMKNIKIQKSIKECFYFVVWDKEIGYSDEARTKYEYDGQKLTIYQKENPNILIYDSCLRIYVNINAKCFACYGKKEIEQPLYRDNEQNCWRIEFDFNKPIDRIKISFNEEDLDDYLIDVKYVFVDKEQYYKKIQEQHKQELTNNMHIDVQARGKNINVFFAPANESYAYSVIELYRGSKQYQFLKQYRLPDGENIWMEDNLVYSNQICFVIKQFDKDDNLIVETDKFPFPNYSYI